MNKNILMTSAWLALGIASQAGAANVAYLTGSTAFRGNTYTVLSTATNVGGCFDGTPDIASYGGSAANKGNYMLFHGNVKGVETYVDCFWSGSEAGIAAVAGVTVQNDTFGNLPGAPATFLKADGTVPYGIGTTNPPAGYLQGSTTQPDLTMADTSTAVSLTKNANLVDVGGGPIGIVTFTWVKNYQSAPNQVGSWTNLVNVTHPQLQIGLGGAQIAAFYTGKAGDTNQFVYVVGRNKGSGTRVNALADAAYGITTPVDQFSIGGLPYGTAAANPSTLAEVTDNGYESGGDVSKALSLDGSTTTADPINTGNTGYIAIGYLGTSDANANNLTFPPAGNTWLTLNGVLESDGAIEQGQYSMWGHEHLYGKSGVTSGAAYNFGVLLAHQIPASLGGSSPSAHSSGINVSYMQCDKGVGSDTAVPSHY